MRLYYNDKNICIKLHVSCENQDRIKKYIDPSFKPLFELKKEQYFTAKFEHKSFTCSYRNEKQEFFYKKILRIETETDGLIIYLDNHTYISIATERSEKHNSELHDLVTFLKKRCLYDFFVKSPIQYPEDEDAGRYQTNDCPTAEISFTLTDAEIRRMLWYDYLFGENMLVFSIPFFALLILSVVFWNTWLLVASAIIATFRLILDKSFFDGLDGYKNNYQGELFMLMYDKLLVVRLHNTDLELEYATMKRKKSFFGCWRLQSGDFFTLILPKRIADDNPSFFNALYAKIK